MKNKDAFGDCHPAVNFLYFGLTIGFSMFFMHPVCLLISLFCSVSYYIKLKGRKAVLFLLRFAFPMLLLTALINPAFNHGGSIILCYMPTGNPLTLESILYGTAAAAMLVSVFLWFGCYTEVMSSDKFIYMFGKIIPSLSLVLSMTLRFVPKFKQQFERVKDAQAGLGRDISSGSVFKRVKNAAVCFSVMVTWSLENAIETADSMKSRGYGLKGRTAFSTYIFSERDKYLILWLGVCGAFLFSGGLSGALFWRYFPNIRGNTADPITICLELVYFSMLITPLIIDGREERKWKRLKSKI